MKRWQNLVAVGGFLIVIAFVAERFSRMPASWTKVSGLGHDIVIVEILFVLLALLFLAILRGGYLLYRKTWRKEPRDGPAEPQHSLAGRWPHIARVGVLSLASGIAVESLTGMRTPGTLALRVIFPVDVHDHIVAGFLMILLFVMPIVVDSAICFAILWGGYLLWKKVRREGSRKNLEVGK
jgi:hypothetical protein